MVAFLSLVAAGPPEDAQAAAASAAEQPKTLLPPGRDRRPTDAWPTTAPEACEGDTNHLAGSLEQLPQVGPNLHSLLAGSIRSLLIRPYGLIAETRLFADDREFGGLQVPTRVVSHIQGPEAVFTRTSVDFNDIDPRAFELPIPIDAILKGKRASGGKLQFWCSCQDNPGTRP